MTEEAFKFILAKHYPGIKFFKSEDGSETWVYPWNTPEETWGLEKVSFYNLGPHSKYALLSKSDKNPYVHPNETGDYPDWQPYRFPNNTLFFERWVEEQAELHRPFYCGGYPQLDNAPCCVNR